MTQSNLAWEPPARTWLVLSSQTSRLDFAASSVIFPSHDHLNGWSPEQLLRCENNVGIRNNAGLCC